MAHLQTPMVVRSPPCTAPCFSPGSGEPRTFWESEIHKSSSPCQGTFLLLWLHLLFHCTTFLLNPSKSPVLMPPLNHEFNTTPQVLLVLVNFQNKFFTSEQGFRPHCRAASWTGMCCHSPEYHKVGGWLGTPAGSLSKSTTGFQWHIQASLTSWKMVFLCLLFLTISSAKPINKARYSESKGSCHSQQFLFPSFFPHLDAKGAAQWEAIRGENGPHLL